MTDDATPISQRIREAQTRIDHAAARASRDTADVLLVAVTKTHGVGAIRAAYEAGLRHFGENRVEEARDKIEAARQTLPGDVVWHMIGNIQSRKTGDVATFFPWAHSVDRLKIARRLSEAAGAQGLTLSVLLEINLSGENSKSGYDLSSWPGDLAQEGALAQDAQTVAALPHLRLTGLMTMAPFSTDPETARPVFRRLKQLRDRLGEIAPSVDWRHLSMGMSGDFEVAIEEGATIVRLGTLLFGPRES